MALFDSTIHDVPRLPRSERYSLALAHETGKVSAMGHKASKLPARRKGDPTDDGFDESRRRPSLKTPATPNLAQATAHKPAGKMGKNPITGDPVPVAGGPAPSWGPDEPPTRGPVTEAEAIARRIIAARSGDDHHAARTL